MNLSIYFLKFNRRLVINNYWRVPTHCGSSALFMVSSSWQSLCFLGHVEATWEKMKEM